MENNKRVLIVRPGEDPVVEWIHSGLGPMQALVGGNIEMLSIAPNLDIVFNEEGRVMEPPLPLNVLVRDAHKRLWDILGPCFFVRIDDEGSSVSLTDEDIEVAKFSLVHLS